jgi:hypothetical protein
MTDAVWGLAGLTDTIGGWATALLATMEQRLGLLAPIVAGAAAACTVALVMAIYLRGGHHSPHDILRHGVAAIVVIGLLTLVASDARQAALAYLGLTPSRPAVGLQIQSPKATALASQARHRLRSRSSFA